jgi:hypothetical protein
MFPSYHHSTPHIHRLPVELIARIFVVGAALEARDSPFLLKPGRDCYIPPANGFQLHVSHVCIRWRQIALSTSCLWSSIRFREPAHLPRAQAYLARCASSTQLLDILVDTVAPADHIPGITLSTGEFHPIFDIISPHVKRWRALFLKVRDNECKVRARARLSTCGAAPNLETLQLYHFEDFGNAYDLVRATHHPPVMVFEASLPRLRYVSLIGVNLPWRTCPFLRNLRQVELALHRETVRPPYKYWERMLRSSPALEKLALHYSGPRVPPGWAGAVPAVGGGGGATATEDDWPSGKDRAIHLPCLTELSLTDLDPEYLCLLLDHLVLPAVTTLALDLPEQDFMPFVNFLAGVLADEAEGGEGDVGVGEAGEGGEDGDGEAKTLRPYFGRLERLVVSALECSAESWRALFTGLTGLRVLEVDFVRVGYNLYQVLMDGAGAEEEAGEERHVALLPALTTVKASNISGVDLAALIKHRETCKLDVSRWVVRWSERWRGRDKVLDNMVDEGVVEAWIEEDFDYDAEDEVLEEECGWEEDEEESEDDQET